MQVDVADPGEQAVEVLLVAVASREADGEAVDLVEDEAVVALAAAVGAVSREAAVVVAVAVVSQGAVVVAVDVEASHGADTKSPFNGVAGFVLGEVILSGHMGSSVVQHGSLKLVSMACLEMTLAPSVGSAPGRALFALSCSYFHTAL